MKRKIFAGLCAFSMAIGAKGSSEKVAAAPVDTVRYGAQALLCTFETLVSGFIAVISGIECKKSGYGYWHDGSGNMKNPNEVSRFQKIGSHCAVVHGLIGIYSSLKNCLKSEPNLRKNSKDALKSKSSTVSESNVAKNDSKSSGKLLSGAQLVLDAGVFLGFASVCKGIYDDTKKLDVKGVALLYSAMLIPVVSGFYSLCSDGFDFLESQHGRERNIKSLEMNTKKSEQNLKDKK